MLSDCEKFLTALDNRTQYAVQDFPVTRSHRLEVWRGDDGYTLREDGRSLDPQPDAEAAAEALFYRLYELSFEALPQFTKIPHAGCASWQGKRFLVAGPRVPGKPRWSRGCFLRVLQSIATMWSCCVKERCSRIRVDCI